MSKRTSCEIPSVTDLTGGQARFEYYSLRNYKRETRSIHGTRKQINTRVEVPVYKRGCESTIKGAKHFYLPFQERGD